MTPTQAQRLRFGILAARSTWEAERLTTDQEDYLEGCELSGWRPSDSVKAYRREYDKAMERVLPRKGH